jgi:hypothetical protein
MPEGQVPSLLIWINLALWGILLTAVWRGYDGSAKRSDAQDLKVEGIAKEFDQRVKELVLRMEKKLDQVLAELALANKELSSHGYEIRSLRDWRHEQANELNLMLLENRADQLARLKKKVSAPPDEEEGNT